METPVLARLFTSLRNIVRNVFHLASRSALDVEILVDNCPEGVVLARNGVIVNANPALLEAFDCSAEELVGQPLTGFLRSRDRTAWMTLLTELRSTRRGEYIEGEFTVRTESGAAQRQVILRLCRAGRGRDEQLIVFVEDVTSLRRSEGALRDHARRLRLLARQVIDVQEAERRHIARELHDEIGQQLTLLKMSLHAARNERRGLQQALAQVEILTHQIRSMSLDLRPSMLDDLGLVAALHWYVKRTADITGLRFDAELPEDFPRLPPEAETAFFRVAQESINNAVKHSAATRVTLRLSLETTTARLEVGDNGSGFHSADLLQAAHDGSGGGLLGMQERAALVGARVQVLSEPSMGCKVRMELPVQTHGGTGSSSGNERHSLG